MADLLKKDEDVPPSVGKTVAIAVTIPTAAQDVLWTVLHELWGFEWATPRFIASLVLLVSFMVAGLMHRNQRINEHKEDLKNEPTSQAG